jgi:hypothetical protein
VHHLSTGATTNGRFGRYRWDLGPAPSGAEFFLRHDTCWI